MIVILDSSKEDETSNFKQFSNKEIANRDAINCRIVNRVHKILNAVEGLNIKTTKDFETLEDKIKFINRFNKKNTVLISLGSSQSFLIGGNGVEISYVMGRPRADKLAKFCINELLRGLRTYNTSFKFKYVHREYEEDICNNIMRKTKCPSVVINSLSYKDYEQYKLLMNDDFIDELAISIAEGVIEFANTVIHKIDIEQ